MKEEEIAGVYFSPQYGASCPKCHKTGVPAHSRRPWINGVKIRYHQCGCGCAFKSIQLDPTRHI